MINTPKIIIVGLLCMAFPALGEEFVTADEFEAMSLNKTLYFNAGGNFHGAEQYFPNRLVTWKFANGDCDQGRWYAEADAICFTYETNPVPQCWNFIRTDTGFYARQLGAAPENDLYLNFINTEELLCEAPFLGASFSQ